MYEVRSRVADRIANTKSSVKASCFARGYRKEIIEKGCCGRVLPCQGATSQESQRLRSLGLAIHVHPCPGDGTWRTATASCPAQLHRVHQPPTTPPVRGLRISQPGTCNAGPSQPMGARHPLLRRATNPHSSKFRNFQSSASVIPFDHQHTSPLPDSPIRQAESVKMPVCPVPLEPSNFTSASGPVDFLAVAAGA